MAASPFIDTAEYPSVRRAISTDLDAATLPDATIADAIYRGRAAAMILAMDPDAASRTGDAEASIKLATVFQTAALLLPALPSIVSEKFTDYAATYATISVRERVAALEEAAREQVGIAVGSSEPAARRYITGFTTKAGRRGA